MSRQSPRCGAGESALTWSYRGAADRFEVPGRAEVWGTVKARTGDIEVDRDEGERERFAIKATGTKLAWVRDGGGRAPVTPGLKQPGD